MAGLGLRQGMVRVAVNFSEGVMADENELRGGDCAGEIE
jgi:hypothetical protein